MPPPPSSRPVLNGNGHIGHHGHPPVAQPVRHQQPYYRGYSSSSSASLKGCCCCLFLLFAFLALLVLAVVLIVILAVKPKKPQFDLQQVAVVNMGIVPQNNPNPSVLDPTSASLSFTIRMLFTAGNPNKVGIRYGESSFTVMYKGMPLGRATVAGFYQDAHSTRNVETTIAVDRVNLMQGNAGDLVRDASLNDRVDLTIRGDVSAKIRVMNFDSPGVQVSVNCGIGISPRKQALIYKQCGFDGVSV
uniref:Late embryogenesis abundant protein LEA-2 subgroup domain-containing protein n=1 Tax=Noccaea caerulescens TaxID=107243 RepID=A0A1J3G0G0_NOCCA